MPRQAGLTPSLHVVAGILGDTQGRVLVARRPAGKHHAGAWEFPGGKLEAGETPQAALRRELHEELGIEIGAVEPVIGVPWRYPEKSIFLDAYRVLDFTGLPHGREGQALQWRHPRDLADVAMPEPDRPIATALRLPAFYAITPEPDDDDTAFLARIEHALADGARLLQLRAKNLAPARLRHLAQAVRMRVREAQAQWLLNGAPPLADELGADGVHLPSPALMRATQRPLAKDRWVAASCHDACELAQAARIGADFAVLGPLRRTRSHPDADPLGWARFAELCATAALPVFALGGLGRDDLAAAKAAGAQGIAGISAFFG